MTAAAPPSNRWLFGPGRDLLLGCGLGYALLFMALIFAGHQLRTGITPNLLPFLSLLIGAPHYGATLLRVYERREDRQAYAVFAVHVSLVLLVAFVASTRLVWLGSALLTLYISWSPWHYSGQNYGLAVMFLRRRGVALDGAVKRLVYASFILSYALTLVALHRASGSSGYAPLSYTEATYRFLPVGIPAPWADSLLVVLLAAYLLSLGGAAVMLLRRAPARDLGAAAMLTLTQALWFSIPVVVRYAELLPGIEPLSNEHATYYFFWVAIGHSVQYLWVTSYYARRTDTFRGYGNYFWKTLLAGMAIWTVPAFLFAPDLLGHLPFDAGLSALVASTVNIHHFILDGAIWKLRDGRVARILIRTARPEPAAAGPPVGRQRNWLVRSVWALGAASLAISLFANFELEFGVRRALARADVARLRVASQRLDRIGRESLRIHLRLGQLLGQFGNTVGALHEYDRSIELYATANAWMAKAGLFERSSQDDAALDAYQRALALDPAAEEAHIGAARIWSRRGDHEHAVAALEEAVRLDPERRLLRELLERARARAAAAP